MNKNLLKYRHWYRDCSNALYKKYGQNTNLFIDLLAATSPRKNIKANFKLANRIFHRHMNNLSIEYSQLLPAARKNVGRAILRQELSGNKVRAFAQNLKGNLNVVTIDVWMLRYYRIE